MAAQDSNEPVSDLWQFFNNFFPFFFSGSKRICLPTQSTRTATGMKVKLNSKQRKLTSGVDIGLEEYKWQEQCEVQRKYCHKVMSLNIICVVPIQEGWTIMLG